MDIAIDVGHSTVKGLSGNGARTLFPSLITPAPAAVDLGEYGQAQTALIDGTSYLVGEPAQSYASPLWGRDKAADEDTIRLVLVAAARLGPVGDVRAAVGLPLSWYASQRRAAARALTGQQATVILPREDPRPIPITEVRVLPQGIAAAIAVLGHPVTESDAWLVVDVGYRTTDHVMISRAPGKAMAPDLAASGTIEIGMSVVARTVAAQIEKVRGGTGHIQRGRDGRGSDDPGPKDRPDRLPSPSHRGSSRPAGARTPTTARGALGSYRRDPARRRRGSRPGRCPPDAARRPSAGAAGAPMGQRVWFSNRPTACPDGATHYAFSHPGLRPLSLTNWHHPLRSRDEWCQIRAETARKSRQGAVLVVPPRGRCSGMAGARRYVIRISDPGLQDVIAAIPPGQRNAALTRALAAALLPGGWSDLVTRLGALEQAVRAGVAARPPTTSPDLGDARSAWDSMLAAFDGHAHPDPPTPTGAVGSPAAPRPKADAVRPDRAPPP